MNILFQIINYAANLQTKLTGISILSFTNRMSSNSNSNEQPNNSMYRMVPKDDDVECAGASNGEQVRAIDKGKDKGRLGDTIEMVDKKKKKNTPASSAGGGEVEAGMNVNQDTDGDNDSDIEVDDEEKERRQYQSSLLLDGSGITNNSDGNNGVDIDGYQAGAGSGPVVITTLIWYRLVFVSFMGGLLLLSNIGAGPSLLTYVCLLLLGYTSSQSLVTAVITGGVCSW